MSDWVDRLEFRRGQFVRAFGGSAVDLNGITAAILPLILIVSILDRYILSDIISSVWLRGLAALLSGLVIEMYAIAVMILDHEVSTYNRTLRLTEVSINYNGSAAKRNYVILLILVVVFGHIVPGILEALLQWLWPEVISLAVQPVRLVVLFMAFISWYSYEIFSTNYLLRERLVQRRALDQKAEEHQRLMESAKAADYVAERSRTQDEIQLTLARAKEKEAEAKIASAEARGIKAEALVARSVAPRSATGQLDSATIAAIATALLRSPQPTRDALMDEFQLSRRKLYSYLKRIEEHNGHKEETLAANGMGK